MESRCFMQRASLQDLQCSKTCNSSCKGLIFKTSNASRPAKLHAKGFSSRPAMLQDLQSFKTCNTSFASCKGLLFKTSNTSLCNSSNVQQQQPATFQCFINFECAIAATFYFPTLHQF
eukprot:1291342-Rhodomonas_salina.1